MGLVEGIGAAVGDFFTPQPLWLGRNAGFALFSTGHQAWVVLCLALVLYLASSYWRLARMDNPAATRACRRASLVCAIVPLALLCLHSALMAAAGAFTIEWWPLHLCNVCELLALLYAVSPNEFAGEALVGLGVPASLLALFFPGWMVAPIWSLPSVCGFLEHALVLASAMFVVVGSDIRPKRDHVLRPLLFLAGYAVLIYPFNQRFGTNFAFVGWPLNYGPLALWAEMYGNPGYLVPYAVAFGLIVWGVMAAWRAFATHTKA